MLVNRRSVIIIVLLVLVCSLMGCSDSGGNKRDIVSTPELATPMPDEYGIVNYLIEQNYQGSVLVYEQGLELFSGGFGYANRAQNVPNDQNTNFRIGSVSKQFTAMAIMILQERGMVSLDGLVSEYLFNYPHGDRITVQQLLNHTSGTPNYTEFDFYPSVVEQPHTLEHVIAYFKNEPLEFEPGSQFNYSNSGYVLLGAIIESVSQVSYTAFLRDEIFAPLGMSQSGYLDLAQYNIELSLGYLSDYTPSPFIHPTLPNADGGLASNVIDLLKWHQALQNNVLISEASKQMMFAPWLENIASGWFVGNYFNTPVYFHGGGYSGFRAGIYHYPTQDRLIVLLSNSEETDINSLARRIDELIRR